MTSLKARLAKARARLFGTAARDVPVPFELPCDCGHRVTGIRRPTYQIAVCSACQASIYVLPVNVYPATRRVRSEVVDGPVVSRVGTVVRDLIAGADESTGRSPDSATQSAESAVVATKAAPETSAEDARNRRRRSKPGRRSSASDVAEPEAVIEQSDDGTPLVRLPRVSVATRLKKAFSPTRLLALAGAGLLVATGWWMIRQQQMEEARKVWRQEMDLVETAIKDRDLPSLQTALKKAVDAARILNRTDAESREAKSLLRQTEAVQNISSTDLVSLLSGIVLKDGTLNSTEAQKISESTIGQQLLFEAVLKEKSGNNQIPELDLPLIVDGIPLRIFVPSQYLSACAESDPSMPLLFIATVRKCQPPSDPSGEWQMSLDAGSCTLITTEFHAEKVGYDLSQTPRLRQTLERQAEFVRSTAGTLSDSVILADQEEQR